MQLGKLINNSCRIGRNAERNICILGSQCHLGHFLLPSSPSIYTPTTYISFYPTPYNISCVSSQCTSHTGKSIAITQQSSGEHGSEMLLLWRVLLPTRVVVPKYPSLLLLLELCNNFAFTLECFRNSNRMPLKFYNLPFQTNC